MNIYETPLPIKEESEIIIKSISPAVSLTFKTEVANEVEIQDNGIPFRIVKSCYINFTNRDSTKSREFAMKDCGIFIMYNTDNKICGVLFTEPEDKDHHKNLHKEFEKTLDLLKDVEAIQGYRVMAYYWSVIQSGFSLVSDIQIPSLEGTDGNHYFNEEEQPDFFSSIDEEDDEE